MGYSYVKRYLGLKKPSVSLLNIGKEPSKGTKILFEAGEILKSRCEGYSGFVEGYDVFLGKTNVVVCDGFVGNVLLKTCESFHVLARSVLSLDKEVADVVTKKMSILNPENYGAVPFLGVRGIVLKAHGGSNERAITNAILTAILSVKKQALEHKVPSSRKGV